MNGRAALRSVAAQIALGVLANLGACDDGGGAAPANAEPGDVGGLGDVGAGSGGGTSDGEGNDVPDAGPTYDFEVPVGQGYSEPIAEGADLSDLAGAYDPANWYAVVLEMLSRRYPAGHHIVSTLETSEALAMQWIDASAHLGDGRASFTGLARSLSTVVHELAHAQSEVRSTADTKVYVLRDDLVVSARRLATFSRSEIGPQLVGPLAEGPNIYYFYVAPDWFGEQDFYSLMDEFNAYTHSLFTSHGVYDWFDDWGATERLGIVTFMVYLELYLRLARTDHPAVHAALLADDANRAMIATLWRRAVFILDVARDIPYLDVNVGPAEAVMLEPALQAELLPFLE